MFGKEKLCVLIVGAGPVGLFAALVLARRGVRIQIVDKEWRTGAHSYALALHAQSLRLLEAVGLLPRILEKGYAVTRIGLYEGLGQQAEIPLTNNVNTLPSLVVLRQDVLESLLEDALADCGVHVRWNHRASKLVLQPDTVVVTIDKLQQESVGYAIAHTEWVVAKSTECEASFVVGADGCHSFLRRAAEIDFPVVGDSQCYAVFELRSDMDLSHEMRIVMGDTTTDVLWPLPDGFCRWSFELPGFSLPADSRKKDRFALSLSGAEFPVLSEGSCRALIAERAPWFKGTIGEMDWRVAVRFEHRLANAFGKDRIGLAGDAAHLTGPVGMQSMNIGLREARDLAEVIGEVLHGGEPAEHLGLYNVRSLARWRHLLGLDDGLQCSNRALPWVCQRKERFQSCIPACDRDFAELAERIGLRAL
ncbi:MAG: FAD-dependent oxidoreductase [Thermoguttaceae bacterium]